MIWIQLKKNTKIESELMKEVIQVSVDTVNESKLYTTKAIPNGTSFRSKLESSLKDKSEKDRQAIAKSLKNGQNEKLFLKNMKMIKILKLGIKKHIKH